MSKNKNQKTRLCWNCEGRIALKEEVCPSCGVSVIPASLDGPPTQTFAPPYQFGSAEGGAIPDSPYSTMQDSSRSSESAVLVSEEIENSADDFKGSFLAITLLLSGSVFFIFGLMLAIFSHNGVLSLQWDGSLWFIYSGLSLPLIILGWRMTMKL